MDLKFRPATQNDCESLATLINAGYRGDKSRAGWTTEADLLDGQRTDKNILQSLVAQKESNFLLAFDSKDNLLGCVHLEKRSITNCYLGMLTVNPTGQSQGVGRALLTRAEKFAKEVYGSSKMEMTVITLRHELMAWYERRGYRRTGKIVPFPVHPQFGVLKVASLEMEVLDKSI